MPFTFAEGRPSGGGSNAGDISLDSVFLKAQSFQLCLGHMDIPLVLIIYLPVSPLLNKMDSL